MNCRRARPNIALSIGNDLDEQSERNVRRHLAVCPQCREYARSLRDSLKVLERSEKTPAERMHDSVWPDLSNRLRPADSGRRPERFNGWMPALAVVAACVTLVLISNNTTPQGLVRPADDALVLPRMVIRAGNPDVRSVRFLFHDDRAVADRGGTPELLWDAILEGDREARSRLQQRTTDRNRQAHVTDEDY